MQHGNLNRNPLLWGLVAIGICLLTVSGCTSGHQVIEYAGSISKHENIVPGIEPEESDQKIMVSVRGMGFEPETGTEVHKRFLAERAAIIDGYRKLSERLAGIIVKSQSDMGKNTLTRDEVVIATSSFLRGARISSILHQEGYATADLRVYLAPRQLRFYNGPFGNKKMLDALGSAAIGAAVGAGVASFFDGGATLGGAAVGGGLGPMIFD